MNNSLGEIDLGHLSKHLLASQDFGLQSFADARSRVDFLIGTDGHYVEYDRFTMTVFDTSLPANLLLELRTQVYAGLRAGLSPEKMQWWYEYYALLWFCICNRLSYPVIKKTLRPDFEVIDEHGRRIGIEVTEFTSAIDKKRMKAHALFGGLPYTVAKERIHRYMGEDASLFSIEPSGDSSSLIPKAATCLSDEREDIAGKFYEKYLKYFINSDTGSAYDEFIILGDALHSVINITSSNEALDILEMLKQRSYHHKVTLAVVHRDYKDAAFIRYRTCGFSVTGLESS